MSGSTLCFVMAGVFVLCGLGSADRRMLPLGFAFGAACVLIGLIALASET